MHDEIPLERASSRVSKWLLLLVLASASLVMLLVALFGETSRSAYVVPGGLALIAALSLRAPAHLRANLAALLVVAAPLPWLADAAIGWVERRGTARAEQAQRDHTTAQGWVFDERTLEGAIAEARQKSGDAVPAIHATGLFRDSAGVNLTVLADATGAPLLPLAGIANVATLASPREGGHYFTFMADEHGFNNPPGVWSAPKIDIALVGDSFAHGMAVPRDGDLAASLRARWPLTLNLGYRGNGPLVELATLLEYLPQRRPQVVLWVVCETNDIGEDLDRESRSPLLREYLKTGRPVQALEARQAEIDAVLRPVAVRAQQLAPAPGLRERIQRSSLMLHRLRFIAEQVLRPVRDDWVGLADVLRVADSAVRGWGGKMYVVYLPVHLARPDSPLRVAQRGPPEERRRRLHAIGDSLELAVIDVLEKFERTGDAARTYVYPYPAHFTPAGYLAAGSAIVERLDGDQRTNGRTRRNVSASLSLAPSARALNANRAGLELRRP